MQGNSFKPRSWSFDIQLLGEEAKECEDGGHLAENHPCPSVHKSQDGGGVTHQGSATASSGAYLNFAQENTVIGSLSFNAPSANVVTV